MPSVVQILGNSALPGAAFVGALTAQAEVADDVSKYYDD
jgi:hypothetical protein